MKAPFDIDKAAQCAHYFLKHGGGELEILKLVKLIYLADRRSFEIRRVPIVGGTYYSLEHGPVTSEVLDLINDGTPSGDSVWERLVSDRANHCVAASADLPEYHALSQSELGLLEEVWSQFGGKGKWDLVVWTHRRCEEWTNPHGGRAEISARRLAGTFGWGPSEIDDFEDDLAAQNRLHEALN